VSARNLYDFFNNKGNSGSVDVKAYALYRRDTTRDSTSGISQTMRLLNAQCFHMSEKRFSDADKKITLDRIRETFDWIESNIGDLVGSFKDEFRTKLKTERADLGTQEGMLKTADPTGPSSSGWASLIQSGPTSICHTIDFSVDPKK
jgi:hypothetical protein